jgi:hypothetical protein
MIVPRMPPAWPPLAGGGGLGDVSVGDGDGEGADEAGDGAGLVAGGAGVCVDVGGRAEDGRLPGLDDAADFAARAVDDGLPVAPPPAPGWPLDGWRPDRGPVGVLAAGGACADGTAEATAGLAGGEA